MEQINPVLLDCLETLTGITRGNCPCYTNLPDDEENKKLITESQSGLYMDEVEGFTPRLLLKTAGPCSAGSTWDKLIQARRYAIVDTAQNLSVALMNDYTAATDRNLMVGEQTYVGPYQRLLGGKVSYYFQMSKLAGGVISFTHVGFLARLINPEGPAPKLVIRIRRIDQSTDYAMFRINILESERQPGMPDTTLYALPNELKIPCDGNTYEISYLYDPTVFVPFQNKLRCVGCTATMYDIQPYFESMPTGEAYGLMWNITFTCDMQFLACALKQDSVLKVLIAEAIQFRTIERWLSILKGESQVGTTSQNVLQSKQIPDVIASFAALFASRIQTIVQTALIDQKSAGCFACRYNSKGGRAPIIQGEPIPLDYYGEVQGDTVGIDGWELVRKNLPPGFRD